MPEYLTPDVYVEEVPAGPRPIEAVGTSTAAFVGPAPRADVSPNDPVAYTNWMQFTRDFTRPDTASTPLSNAVYGFFQNGGSRCFVVNVPEGQPVEDGLAALEAVDEVAIVAAPGLMDAASYEAVLGHCEKLKDRVAILDGPQTGPDDAVFQTFRRNRGHTDRWLRPGVVPPAPIPSPAEVDTLATWFRRWESFPPAREKGPR